MESDYRYPAPSTSNPQHSPSWFDWFDVRARNHYDDVDEITLPFVHRRHLGNGGYGLVEEVEVRTTGRVFARKVFHPRKRERARMREMFENEVRNTRALAAHHHMVQLHATYTTKDTLAMIMTPVADDGDLEKFLDELTHSRNGYASWDSRYEAAQMRPRIRLLQTPFGCLASGLTFMHDQKIRHKDIKPSNILIHRGRVLYTDFGIARDTALFQDSATTGPAIKATRKYAAPEVVADASRRSSSDVYSLGCVFIEIFASLNGSVKIPDVQRFSDNMDSIRKALHTWSGGTREMEVIAALIPGMTEEDPSMRFKARSIWRACDHFCALRCGKCHSFHANSTSPQTQYSSWAYSGTLKKYYYHRLNAKHQIEDTLWSMYPLLDQQGLHDHSEGRPHLHHYLETHAGLHGIHHSLDDRPGGHWTSWIWSKLHEQYYSHFIRTDGDTVAIL